MWVATAILGGAFGLSLALAFVASWIGSDAEGVAMSVIWLISMPAFLLLLPMLILAALVDYAGRWGPGKPIVASWDVRVDGEVHVVSLPASSRFASSDHAWVDGERMPLAWTPTGVTTARAALDGGTLSGTLSMGYDSRELAFDVVSLVVAAASFPTSRYALQVEGATVEEIPVADGARRSWASLTARSAGQKAAAVPTTSRTPAQNSGADRGGRGVPPDNAR